METDEAIYRRHAAGLTGFATCLVGPADAPDVVSEAVMRALASREWPTVVERRAYLHRCVLNEARTFKRSQSRRRARERRVASREAIDDIQVLPDVLYAIARLSARQRAVIYLTYWEDQSADSIADWLAISEGSVKRHLARARSILRRELMPDER